MRRDIVQGDHIRGSFQIGTKLSPRIFASIAAFLAQSSEATPLLVG
jgi:hypothetical protein